MAPPPDTELPQDDGRAADAVPDLVLVGGVVIAMDEPRGTRVGTGVVSGSRAVVSAGAGGVSRSRGDGSTGAAGSSAAKADASAGSGGPGPHSDGVADAMRASATALAVRAGRIVAVGTDEEMLALAGAGTRRLDLAGRAVLPGFQDAHAHPLVEGVRLSMLDLTVTRDRAAALLLVRRASAENRDPSRNDSWVEARYHPAVWPDGRHPTRDELDRAAPDVPVLLYHGSGHAVVANSVALALAGVTAERADPPGATVERDPAGEPTGLVLGSDPAAPFASAVPPLTPGALRRAARRAFERLLADGVTAVSDADVGTLGNAAAEISAYVAASHAAPGPCITLMPGLARLIRADEDPPSPSDIAAQIPRDVGARVRVGPAKHFSDGAFTTGDAWLRDPYADRDDRPAELRLGRPAHPNGELLERLRRAHRAGWQLATHAIGDAAISATLDAYRTILDEAPRADHRHRLEHAMLLPDDLLREAIALDVLAVLQPEFVADTGDVYRARVGPERGADVYAYRRWLDAGLRVAFATDRPVTRGRPLDGIRSAMRHAGPSGVRLARGQEPTVAETLHAWTVGAAWATRDEARAGRVAPGLAADLVVLSADPRGIPPERWAAGDDGVEVVATIVGGHVVHGEDALR